MKNNFNNLNNQNYYSDKELKVFGIKKDGTPYKVFTPFYKFNEWKALIHRLLWLFRNYKVSCVMLKKN